MGSKFFLLGTVKGVGILGRQSGLGIERKSNSFGKSCLDCHQKDSIFFVLLTGQTKIAIVKQLWISTLEKTAYSKSKQKAAAAAASVHAALGLALLLV